MLNDKTKLVNMVKHLELLRLDIIRRIHQLEREQNLTPLQRLSSFKTTSFKPRNINDYQVFQFGYDGMLPHYDSEDISYLRKIRNYYYQATLDAYDFKAVKERLNNAVIIYAQYFKDNLIRDLDNRNTKFIQDAIKRTGLIGDDSWRNIWNFNIGFKDERANHVQVFVVERSNFSDFSEYLIENHEELKPNSSCILPKQDFFEAYKNRDKSTEADKEISNLFSEIK